MLVVGGMALIFVLGIVRTINPRLPLESVSFYPGFWACVGLLVLSAVMSWVIMMATVLIVGLVEAKFRVEGAISEIITIVLFPLGGFLSVFIYGAWLGAQLRHAL